MDTPEDKRPDDWFVTEPSLSGFFEPATIWPVGAKGWIRVAAFVISIPALVAPVALIALYTAIDPIILTIGAVIVVAAYVLVMIRLFDRHTNTTPIRRQYQEDQTHA